MEYLKGHTLIQSMAYGEGDYFIWKFNADGTGIEQEYYHGGLESPVSFTYTYDAKTTVLTVTYIWFQRILILIMLHLAVIP